MTLHRSRLPLLVAAALALVLTTLTAADRREPPLGDIDGDGDVDLDDRSRLVELFGLRGNDTGWRPEADLDGDGRITIVDYGRWLETLEAADDDVPPPVSANEQAATRCCGLVGLEVLAAPLLGSVWPRGRGARQTRRTCDVRSSISTRGATASRMRRPVHSRPVATSNV